MAPLFSVKKYSVSEGMLRVLQKDGWVSLPLADVTELKKHSLTRAVVRLSSGKTAILDFSQFSTDAFSAIVETLQRAVLDFRVRSSLHQ